MLNWAKWSWTWNLCRSDHRQEIYDRDGTDVSELFFCVCLLTTNREGEQPKKEKATNSTYGKQKQTYKLKFKPIAQAVYWSGLFSRVCALSQTNGLPQKQHEPLSIHQRKRGRERRSRVLVKGSETKARETSALDPFLVASVPFLWSFLFVHG